MTTKVKIFKYFIYLTDTVIKLDFSNYLQMKQSYEIKVLNIVILKTYQINIQNQFKNKIIIHISQTYCIFFCKKKELKKLQVLYKFQITFFVCLYEL